jgi:hypothetical protein
VNVLIVIPAFDEAPTIARVVTAARAHAPVLVVDDGSRDGTATAAAAAGAEVLHHRRRLGKGQALRTGIAAARVRGATAVVTLDGDGQHDPCDLPRLLETARAMPGAIVVGDRLAGEHGLAPGRLNAIHVAGFFVNWASGARVRDTQSGFRVYPLAFFDDVRPRRGGFVFETEVLVAAALHGVPVREVPIGTASRAARRSRFRPVSDGVAIGAYLTGRAFARWAIEVGYAVDNFVSVFRRERRVARHARMVAAVTSYPSAPTMWGVALGAAAMREISNGLESFWKSPRRRRAGAASVACAAAPAVLVLGVAKAMGGRMVPDLVTPIVRRLYAQERLDTPSVADPTMRREPPSLESDAFPAPPARQT